MSLNPLTTDQALQKLRHYCAYQERSHKEVKEKLYSYGLHKRETEEAVSQLIEEGYLNEERFAIQYAGGKFRMKQWGKIKIRYELKLKQVSDYCIRKALQQIGEEDYEKTLDHLAGEKWRLLRGEQNHFAKKRKLQDYLLQKGFESDRVIEMVKKYSSNLTED